jgi:RimJ/RimL family protein N-acetyltransferase
MQTSAKNVVIRNALPEDATSYRDLRLEALRNHPEAFWEDYEEQAALPTPFWQEQLRNVHDSSSSLIQLAVSDGTLVGMTAISRTESPKHRHVGVIWGVYVRPAWRGLRIANNLIASCLAWAQTQQLRVVKLAVSATNVAAIRCYLRCGFSVYGVDPEVIYYDGMYYDELLMARHL